MSDSVRIVKAENGYVADFGSRTEVYLSLDGLFTKLLLWGDGLTPAAPPTSDGYGRVAIHRKQEQS